MHYTLKSYFGDNCKMIASSEKSNDGRSRANEAAKIERLHNHLGAY